MEIVENKEKGYKKTELGLIPEDWTVEELDHLSEKIGSGITPRGGSKIYLNEGRPFVRSQNIGWGNLKLNDLKFINDEVHSTFPNTEIKLNDVFLNISGASIGRSAYANKILVGGNVNQHVCIVRALSNKLTPIFLNKILLSKIGQKQVDSYQSGGNREGLNIGQIKSFQIPLPPTLTEQIAIAEALSSVDDLIEKQEALITKKQAIKEGAMQKLLTPPQKGGQRLPGFDGEWEEKKLGEVCELINGRAYKNDELLDNGKYAVLRVGNLFSSNKWYYSDLELPEKQYVNKGDLMYAWSASFGPQFWLKDKTIYHYHIWKVNVFENTHKQFLFYQMQSDKVAILNESQGGTMFHITKSAMEQRELSLPASVGEQKAIAKILSDMDLEIEKLQAQKTKFQKIKEGMMQELLTGKTRLV
ncbi:MAG: restriction endonuclease subunit S [Bacteroidota bacterium]